MGLKIRLSRSRSGRTADGLRFDARLQSHHAEQLREALADGFLVVQKPQEAVRRLFILMIIRVMFDHVLVDRFDFFFFRRTAFGRGLRDAADLLIILDSFCRRVRLDFLVADQTLHFKLCAIAELHIDVRRVIFDRCVHLRADRRSPCRTVYVQDLVQMLGRADLELRQKIFLCLHIQRIQGVRVADSHALRVGYRYSLELRLVNAVTGRTVVPDIREQAPVDLAVAAEGAVDCQIRMAAREASACHGQVHIALHRERVVAAEAAAADVDIRPVFPGKSRQAAGLFACEAAAADSQLAAGRIASVIGSAQLAAGNVDLRFRGSQKRQSVVAPQTAALDVQGTLHLLDAALRTDEAAAFYRRLAARIIHRVIFAAELAAVDDQSAGVTADRVLIIGIADLSAALAVRDRQFAALDGDQPGFLILALDAVSVQIQAFGLAFDHDRLGQATDICR